MNKNQVYASKYTHEAAQFLEEAREVARKEHWSGTDKQQIRIELEKKLKRELERRDFLDEKKFEYMNVEISTALKQLELI